MKMKKLLAAAMAATMIFSSMVTSLVASADSVGTIAAGNVTVCPTDAATVDVDVNIPLGAGITAPHIMLEFLLDGYKLTGATSTVIGANDITVNADAGKIIIETAVKDAPTLTAIDLKVSFAVVDAAAAGTYNLTVNVLDATNVEEEDVVIGGTTATVTVAHAHKAAVTAPTCTAEGFTTYTCACGDTYKGDTVAALGHSFAEGTCTVCGEADPNYVPPVTEPEVDPAFDTSLRFMVGIAETVGVNVIFTKPEKYDSFKVKVNRNAFDNSYNYTPATEIVWEADDAYMTSGRQYGFRYRDVPLYAMSEKIVFTFEGYEDGVLTGISNAYEWRLDEFVASYVNNPSTAAKTRELYSEVLWLGEYAHINFKKSAAATASIQFLPSPVALISTQPIEGYVIPDLSKEVAEANGVTFSRTMVGVTTAPTFKVIMSGMTADIRANAAFTASHTSKLLTPNLQEFTYSLNANDNVMMQSGAMNAYTHSNIALYDGDKLIEFKVVKDGVVLGKYTTSLAIETYQAREEAIKQGKTDLANMYDRVLILGETARRCFNG